MRHAAVRGVNFRPHSLERAVLSHTDLTDCVMPDNCRGANFVFCTGTNVDFSNSDITDSTFEKADVSGFNLIGATWHGETIAWAKRVQTYGYGCLVTSAFVQIGCMQKTMARWEEIGASPKSLRVLLDDQPKIDLETTWGWWELYKAAIRDCIKNEGK